MYILVVVILIFLSFRLLGFAKGGEILLIEYFTILRSLRYGWDDMSADVFSGVFVKKILQYYCIE